MSAVVAPKDYYQILEIATTATEEEVRQAYRTLARRHHPDVNKDSAYAAEYFREILEAYQTLKEPVLRRQYDEQRWLHGMSTRAKDTEVVTASWMLEECKKLDRHLVGIDTFRMSHESLYGYIQLLLSDSHIAVLMRSEEEVAKAQITEHLLRATKGLKHIYQQRLADKLHEIATTDKQHLAIDQQLAEQKRKEKRSAALPYIIVIITLLLCFCMYLWGR